MKVHYWVIALGAYMLLMGIVGYIRTGSPTALYINGGIATATILIGYFWGRNITGMMGNVVIGWVIINSLLLSYMTFKRIAAHADARAGSEFIFGSMALFSIIVLILLIRHRLSA
jgi:hypothetical protein